MASIALEKDNIQITWKTSEIGTGKKGIASFPVYTLQGKIKREIKHYCKTLIQNPKMCQSLNLEDLKLERSFSRIDVICNDSIDREYYTKGRPILKELMDKHIVEYLHELIKEDREDNFMFLAKLGKKRNWKEICAICLVDDIMGTTCGCGHTEIVIFKPCGHSICVSPCFEDWMKSLNIELEQQTKIIDGKSFIIGNQKNVDLDFHNDYPKCPICKTDIHATFRAEDTLAQDIDIEALYNVIYEEFVKKYF